MAEFKDVDRGTDVVGFLGTGHAVYAECTLESPGEAKIASLSGRATDFSRNYERSCSASIDVLACVFVQRDRARIARGVSDMIERHRVALLCNEQAHQLLEMAQRGEEASDVFNFLKAEVSRLRP